MPRGSDAKCRPGVNWSRPFPERVTDPLDIAIVARLKSCENSRPGTILYEQPFDTNQNYAATIWQDLDARVVSVKGAFEAVLGLCSKMSGEEIAALTREHDALAASGMRVLAVAEGALASNAALEDILHWEVRIIGLLSFAE